MERLLLLLSVCFFAPFTYFTGTICFLEVMMLEVGLSVLLILIGLIANVISSKLGMGEVSEGAALLDELTGRLLVRKRLFTTFTRLCLWNLFVSFSIILGGLATFGIFPIIWSFLNMGLLGPRINIYKRYLHSWTETTAIILSSSLGIWGGFNINIILTNPGAVPLGFLTAIVLLHVFSALFETLEIRATDKY